MLPAVGAAKDFSINPGRLALNQLREINFYGFSDMFYYTSRTGKEAVRTAVSRQALSFIDAHREGDEPVRLTLVGHSAGCVIAFDLLFHLFQQVLVVQSTQSYQLDLYFQLILFPHLYQEHLVHQGIL